MREIPRFDKSTNFDILVESNPDIVNLLWETKTTTYGLHCNYTSLMNLFIVSFCCQPVLYPIIHKMLLANRYNADCRLTYQHLVKIVANRPEVPYSLKDIIGMHICGYTPEEISKGYAGWLLNLLMSLDMNDIKDVLYEKELHIVNVVTSKYIYRFPVGLVKKYREELLTTESIYNTGYLISINSTMSIRYQDFIKGRINTVVTNPHQYRKRPSLTGADFKNFTDFVLKTKVLDKDRNRGLFTIECSVRSSETRETCAKHIREIDMAAIKEAEKLLNQWKLPINFFEVSSKRFINGSVLYRFDIKKELEDLLSEQI